MFRTALGVLITTCCVCGVSASAAAQDVAVQTVAAQNAGDEQVAPPTLTVRLVALPHGACVFPPCVSPATRGAVLPLLYVGQIGLQVYDGYSTTRGLRQGAIESNSIMGRLASHPAALWAAKGGAAFASIYVAERLWRQHHRAQAIVVMVASNAIMTAVAARNASVIRAQR